MLFCYMKHFLLKEENKTLKIIKENKKKCNNKMIKKCK